MTKEEKIIAAERAAGMAGWSRQAWATFFRKYAADEVATARHKVDYAALKQYMSAESESVLEADSHRAILQTSRGAAYIDWDGVCADLAAMGIDVDALTTKWARRRPDTTSIRFK